MENHFEAPLFITQITFKVKPDQREIPAVRESLEESSAQQHSLSIYFFDAKKKSMPINAPYSAPRHHVAVSGQVPEEHCPK